jgi:hypothetical protein
MDAITSLKSKIRLALASHPEYWGRVTSMKRCNVDGDAYCKSRDTFPDIHLQCYGLSKGDAQRTPD